MALWRVRATVADKPGFLAVLAASLALREVNILSVGVHITERGAVDDFLVDAPEDLTAEQLLAAVERGRGDNAWVARAEAHSLVDAPTRALDLATYLVRDPASLSTALGELLDAQASWHPEAGPHAAGASGSRMWVPAPGGGAWRVHRTAPDFTPAEYARAQALLAVAAALGVPSGQRHQRPAEGAAAATAPPVTPQVVLLLPDGREVSIRRAGPGDLPAVRAMHGRCSADSLRHRYLGGQPIPTDPGLRRLLDPATGFVLLALSPGAFSERVVAMATVVGEGVQAELGLLVEDAWQRRGIGTVLLRQALAVAARRGFDAAAVHLRARNVALHRILARLGATGRTDRDGELVTVTIPLEYDPAAPFLAAPAA